MLDLFNCIVFQITFQLSINDCVASTKYTAKDRNATVTSSCFHWLFRKSLHSLFQLETDIIGLQKKVLISFTDASNILVGFICECLLVPERTRTQRFSMIRRSCIIVSVKFFTYNLCNTFLI